MDDQFLSWGLSVGQMMRRMEQGGSPLPPSPPPPSSGTTSVGRRPPEAEERQDEWPRTPLLEGTEHRPLDTEGTRRPEEDAELVFKHLEAFQHSSARYVLYVVLGLMTGGVFFLVCHWIPRLHALVRYKRSALADADLVLVSDAHGHITASEVERAFVDLLANGHAFDDGVGEQPTSVRYFLYRHLRFAYDPHRDTFEQVVFDAHVRFRCIHENMAHGLSDKAYQRRLALYGANLIDVPVHSFLHLLRHEVLHPFYVFQWISIVLWSLENYYIYASCIFVISFFSIAVSLVETRRSMVHLRKMAHFECSVTIRRHGQVREVSSAELVPGDLVEIEDHMTLPCDMVLLCGNCIVNESMLTGESVPVLKSHIPPATTEASRALYDVERDKRYTLYAGTNVVQTRRTGARVVQAVVVRTGFTTTKGRLVRSILFPKPSKFKFYQDSFKFVGVMSLIAAVGFTFSVFDLIKYHVPVTEILLRAGDIVTIVVPPALPAAMTIGTSIAVQRMKKKGIFCISPPRVNVSGRLELMCFDKTGTLTHGGMDVMGVVPCFDGSLLDMENEISSLPSPLIHILASCHSITNVHGEMVGDPLDLKMFEATCWDMEEPTGDATEGEQFFPAIDLFEMAGTTEVGVVRRFEFASKLQRMSVVVRDLHSKYMELHVKGSPEILRDLCVPSSVPSTFSTTLSKFTREGYRVLALATRELKGLSWVQAQRTSRETLEKDLTFCGFLVLENRLKDETTPTIKTLMQANVVSVIVTGDNALTAISVGRHCGILDARCPVFLADIEGKNPQGDDALVWRSTKDSTLMLDAVTLEPFKVAMELDDSVVVRGEASSVSTYELAVTGRAFFHLESLAGRDARMARAFHRLLLTTKVFARMSPEDKTRLIEHLVDEDIIVGMCGDGANDCGALKAAHVGVSLSEAEASIAAPFTSKEPHIGCMVKLIREGRAALATSFQCFKYIILYSFIQFVSVIMLYRINSNLADFQYLWIDLFIILPLAVFMCYTGAIKQMGPDAPTGSLLSVHVFSSILGQIVLQALFQVVVLYVFLEHEGWFVPLVPDPVRSNVVCFESTTLFLFTNFQYIAVCLAFNTSRPFRKSILSNRLFTVTLLVLTLCSLILLFTNVSVLVHLFQMQLPPLSFRFKILILVTINSLITWVYERIVVEAFIMKRIWYRVYKEQREQKFQKMQPQRSGPPDGTV